MASILIHSQDHQYGKYLKCLAQQVDLAQDMQIMNSPLQTSLHSTKYPELVVMHAEEDIGDCLDPLLFNKKIPVIVVTSNWKNTCSIIGDIICLAKPLDAVKFVQSVHKCCLLSSNDSGQDIEPTQPYLIGSSPDMTELRRKIARVSSSNLAVLICGQTGTGKGVAAQAVHNRSRRPDDQFLYINCANITGSLLESELFGYKKGAFTGAWRDKPGRLQQAHQGSVFLDEISEMSPYMQAKLLHVLQEKEFYPVGGTASIQINSRIIAATNADLRKEMQAGKFREDLYYRLAVVRLDLPPLSQRRQDIPLLVQYFLDKYCIQYKKLDFSGPSAHLWEMFQEYEWPGNVRELESCINGLVAMESEDLIKDDLYARMPEKRISSKKVNNCHDKNAQMHPSQQSCSPGLSLKEIADEAVENAEAEIISRVLHHTGGRKKMAASVLNVSYKSLLKKIKNYGL